MILLMFLINGLYETVLWATKTDYYPLWPTMTHCGPKYSLYEPQWPDTIYYDLKLLNCFVLTQNELAWHSKSCHRNNFHGKFGPETSKYIVLNQTQSMELFKGFDSEFDNCFLKFHHQSTFCAIYDWKKQNTLF